MKEKPKLRVITDSPAVARAMRRNAEVEMIDTSSPTMKMLEDTHRLEGAKQLAREFIDAVAEASTLSAAIEFLRTEVKRLQQNMQP